MRWRCGGDLQVASDRLSGGRKQLGDIPPLVLSWPLRPHMVATPAKAVRLYGLSQVAGLHLSLRNSRLSLLDRGGFQGKKTKKNTGSKASCTRDS